MTATGEAEPGPLKEIRSSAKKILTTVEVKNWIATETTAANLKHRDRVISFLLRAYGGLLTCTMLIFFLQGFKLWGFSLDYSLMRWLGGATIGEIAGLLTLAIGSVFSHHQKGP